jgi:hypothetical protein
VSERPIYRVTIKVDVAVEEREDALEFAADYLHYLCNEAVCVAGSAEVSDAPVDDEELAGLA